MTKKVASFFPEKIRSAAPGEGPPLFSEQGPAESKSGSDSIILFLKFMPVELILAACTECGRPTFSSCRVWYWLRLGFFYYEVNQSIVYQQIEYVWLFSVLADNFSFVTI